MSVSVDRTRPRATVGHSASQAAPIPAASVRVFTSETELISLDSSRVAVIQATGPEGDTSGGQMIDAMRTKAAELGANAILVAQPSVVALLVRGPRQPETGGPWYAVLDQY